MKANRKTRAPALMAVVLGLAISLVAVACDGEINIDADFGSGDAIGGSGVEVTRDFESRGFTGLDISHAFDADVVRSDTFSVTVTVDDNFIDHLVVEKRGDTLHVGLESGISTRGNVTLEARISMPELRSVEVSGASRADLAGFDPVGRFEVQVSGASRVTGALTADVVDFDVSGASRIDLAGSAGEASIDCSGASRAELVDFTIEQASVQLSGASRADLTVTDVLSDVDVSGASKLVYHGGPSLGGVSSSSGSSIESR